MIKNNYTKLAAVIALMWLLPHCAKKNPPGKTSNPAVALSVQEDCLIIAIERRLNRLEAQTFQPTKGKPANANPVPISASEAVNE